MERTFLSVGDKLWARFFLALTSGLPLETSKHARRTWPFFLFLELIGDNEGDFQGQKSVWYVSALC